MRREIEIGGKSRQRFAISVKEEDNPWREETETLEFNTLWMRITNRKVHKPGEPVHLATENSSEAQVACSRNQTPTETISPRQKLQ